METYLNVISNFNVDLFMQSMQVFVGAMIVGGVVGWCLLRFLEWATDADATDLYESLVEEMESEELALELVDSLYNRAQKSADFDGLLTWVEENPEAAAWLSHHGYDEGFEKLVPEGAKLTMPCCYLDGAGCFCDEADALTQELELEYQDFVDCLSDEQFEEDMRQVLDEEDDELDELFERIAVALDLKSLDAPDHNIPQDTARTKIVTANLVLASLS